MRQLVVVLLCLLFTLKSCPTVEPVTSLMALEQSWLAGGIPKADEMENGRKCWRVEQFDLHGQQVWQAWRCTVLEGPLTGTIQWEWRNPIRR